MRIYINGIGLISPQETHDNSQFLNKVVELTQDFFPINEPVYKDYIKPRDLRRMGKLIRHGIIAGKIAMADAKLSMPEAIITGTGLGCATDTEKFLIKMVENKESLLTPTAFIQSTHNTLGGSIAIGLSCNNYNMTYVQRGLSFEAAILDAQLMLQSGEIRNALVGGFDEMTDYQLRLLLSTDFYSKSSGVKAGQASGFFVFELENTENTYAELLALETVYNPKNVIESISKKIESLINKYHLNAKNTVILMGYNGYNKETNVYNQVTKLFFSNYLITHFKHLCGEYFTASAFSFWLANQILKKQTVPHTLLYNKITIAKEIENVLIFNQFQGKQHSLILLGKC